MATDVVRRNRPGTKSSEFYSWPEQDFNDMETTLAGMRLFYIWEWEMGLKLGNLS